MAITEDRKPVVILGAGINGAAIARELLLNGVSVCIVDVADIASGTTAYSSRLIHGGLRYLEYGEFSLVRESLAERSRLLRLAPQFVKPLRFHIPLRNRFGGWWQSLARFLGRSAGPRVPRGSWLVRVGLLMYDWLVRASELPRSSANKTADGRMDVDAAAFPWTCSYSDAQLIYPERFVVALLSDAADLADQQQLKCEVHTYGRAQLSEGRVQISRGADLIRELEPAAIVNATGAWVDSALEQLRVDSPRLIGGTKGSHLVIDHSELANRLGGEAVYVEAGDGRPVFLLPFLGRTLVGTTDIPHSESPESAIANDDEVSYLLGLVSEVFPGLDVQRTDVASHYSGVRPLPAADSSTPTGAITRRHFFREHVGAEPPIFSVIGGKLTTCRALAEEAAEQVLKRLGLPEQRNSRERPLPGAEGYPVSREGIVEACQEIADQVGLPRSQVETVWELCGSHAGALLSGSETGCVDGTQIPVRFVREIIAREWVERLGDLVERRLMLVFSPHLHADTLHHLARLLCEAGKLEPSQLEDTVESYRSQLSGRYGLEVR